MVLGFVSVTGDKCRLAELPQNVKRIIKSCKSKEEYNMQQADGQVLIRAEMDTSSVTAGIAEMRAALEQLRTYAARQFASIRAGVQSEGNALGG